MASNRTPYKIVCISIHPEDLAKLDAKVAELKQRGWRRASRSHFIQLAVARLSVDAIELQSTAEPDQVEHIDTN